MSLGALGVEHLGNGAPGRPSWITWTSQLEVDAHVGLLGALAIAPLGRSPSMAYLESPDQGEFARSNREIC